MEEAGEEVEKLLGTDPQLHRESWHRIKRWYRDAAECAPPSARVTLERIMAELVDLYSYVPPLGDNIRISVDLFLLDDSLPTVDNIEWLVTQLRNHCSRGPSGMREEHLKEWLLDTRKKERDEAASYQETPTEGTTAGPNRTGRRGRRRSDRRRMWRLPIGRG